MIVHKETVGRIAEKIIKSSFGHLAWREGHSTLRLHTFFSRSQKKRYVKEKKSHDTDVQNCICWIYTRSWIQNSAIVDCKVPWKKSLCVYQGINQLSNWMKSEEKNKGKIDNRPELQVGVLFNVVFFPSAF